MRSSIAQVEKSQALSKPGLDENLAPAFRVIVDHLRCLSFAIADGVNLAISIGDMFYVKFYVGPCVMGACSGWKILFLAEILPRLIDDHGSDYKELLKAHQRIAEILTVRRRSFCRTLVAEATS